MKKVQGSVISQADLIENLELLERFRNKDRNAAAQVVSPENPNGPGIEMVLSGMQVIRSTLEYTKQTRFLVNAFGSRHGVAWQKLAQTKL